MSSKMKVLIMGIKTKLKRGEKLDDILLSYDKLKEEEKTEIREYFAE